jgi:hypothetical protein
MTTGEIHRCIRVYEQVYALVVAAIGKSPKLPDKPGMAAWIRVLRGASHSYQESKNHKAGLVAVRVYLSTFKQPAPAPVVTPPPATPAPKRLKKPAKAPKKPEDAPIQTLGGWMRYRDGGGIPVSVRTSPEGMRAAALDFARAIPVGTEHSPAWVYHTLGFHRRHGQRVLQLAVDLGYVVRVGEGRGLILRRGKLPE